MSTYAELFSITITHDYYRGKICPDFIMEPTPNCRKILKNHHIVMKNKVNGAQFVVAVGNNNQPFIDLSDISKLTFYMKLNQTALSNYTTLTPIEKNKIYYYTSENAQPLKRLRLEHVLKSKVELPANNAAVFAVIEIGNNPVITLSSSPKQYTIRFAAKAINWKYYFITNKSSTATLAVADRNGDTEVITFNSINIENDAIGTELKEKYPANDIHLFRSGAPVSYREAGRRKMKLMNKKNVLIENLPNPSINDNGVKILKAIL